jgi:hypothetical protein
MTSRTLAHAARKSNATAGDPADAERSRTLRCYAAIVANPESERERAHLSHRLDRRDSVHPVLLGPALKRERKETEVETSRGTAAVAVPVEVEAGFLHWPPVIAGAVVAAALSTVLIAFGSALGLSAASTAPTWRNASATFAVLSGLFLVLTALVSFGFGGYLAGRLRRSWAPGLHPEFVDFRDGVHGLVAWALAVLIGALVAAIIGAAASSRAPSTATQASNAGEALIAYDLDRLLRAERRGQGDPTYARAEAGRILLHATSREGMRPDDRGYLARLVAAQTGIAQPDAERRVDEAVAAATQAVKKARQAGVILGFSIAVSLLLGAAAAWYAACLGGQHRDQTAPPLRWELSRI